jgi:hypothetical protein
LAKKREEAFTSADGQQRTSEAITWVETLLGEPLEDKNDLHTSLKSGVVLCKLVCQTLVNCYRSCVGVTDSVSPHHHHQ